MALKESHFYEFGPFRLEPGERRLLRGDRSLPLSPKAFDTLLALVENAGHAIEKKDLLQRVWPDTFVEDGSLAQNIFLLRKILGDEEGPYIETLPKRGYRFVAPVAQWPVSGETLIVDEHTLTRVVTEVETSVWRPVSFRLALAVGLLLAAAAAVVYVSMRGGPPVKSIAVLPLQNLSGGAHTQLELAIADSIIARLSEIPGLTVRPTGAVRTYAEHRKDPLQAARELRVDAVLDGSLQVGDARVRVSLNLLQSSSGASLWTHVFDVPARDIFDLEDDVALNVARQLRLRFDSVRAASPSGPPTKNAEAYDHYLKGLYATEAPRSSGRARIDSAIARFEKATELDPSFAQAWAQLASSRYQIVNFYEPDSDLAGGAADAARRAAALVPNLPELHVYRAQVLWSWGGHFQIEEAIRELRRALGYNSSGVHSLLGVLYSATGLDRPAIGELKCAIEIDPSNALYQDRLAQAYVFLGRYDEARAAYDRVFAIESEADASLHTSAIPFLYADRLDEARRRLERFHARNPRNVTASAYLALLDAVQGNFRDAESAIPADSRDMEKFRESSRAFYVYGSIYALQGKAAQALPWLRKAAIVMPNYPMYARDQRLDRIRNSSEFLAFLAELKSRYDAMQREFR